MNGKIFNIQPFSVYDGDGLRTVVFMNGCNLRCYWCHNPESQFGGAVIMYHAHKCSKCGECVKVCPNTSDGKIALFSASCTKCGKCADVCYNEALELIGYDISSEKLVRKILKDKNLLIDSGGGVTFSGGEPLLQADFVAEAMSMLKDEGINTALESAVCVDYANIEKTLPYCDTYICDLKSMYSQKHKKASGRGNTLILENIKRISGTGKKLIIRTPIIPGFNDSIDDMKAVAEFINTLDCVVSYELLPFHGICSSKYISLGMRYEAENLIEPSSEKINELMSVYKNALREAII